MSNKEIEQAYTNLVAVLTVWVEKDEVYNQAIEHLSLMKNTINLYALQEALDEQAK